MIFSNVNEITENDLVFGLDIGTRNVVGTVGYLDQEKRFHVLGMEMREHKTRAMLDGQIHNINRVAEVIADVKESLEARIGVQLTRVCIAAAGRVLVTQTTHVEYSFPEEQVVTEEDLHTLDLLGIDQAQQKLNKDEDQKYHFYCVGYSVMKYYLNGELFASLEGHRATDIAEDVIVTFLPEDVVDGLYSAVERAGLEVANMTLEPIAAMNLAIPETYRMLNIALVDVGAGTSDICLTKEGSIAAYGMIPNAGDELTEVLVQAYLADFATAEQIKKDAAAKEEVVYRDIMGIQHTVPSEDVWKLTDPIVERITDEVAKKIIELNGGQTVAASFVVGGGGKVHGFTETLAEKLGIMAERVALRGEEVMNEIVFDQDGIKKDPLLVTPIGICLNYYDQNNNFIMIHFNGEMMKLYNNGALSVLDAAIQAGYSTEELFPRRGKELHFTVNGVERMIRGEEGESAQVIMNGQVAGLNTRLELNADVTIQPSTFGGAAHGTIGDLTEFESDVLTFFVNNAKITCPKFVQVNGSLEPKTYEIQEGDEIETRNYYTVGQLAQFMDVELDQDAEILVNNRLATLDTLVYENFDVNWKTLNFATTDGTSQIPPIDAYRNMQATNQIADTLTEIEKVIPTAENLAATETEVTATEPKASEPEITATEPEASESEITATEPEVSESVADSITSSVTPSEADSLTSEVSVAGARPTTVEINLPDFLADAIEPEDTPEDLHSLGPVVDSDIADYVDRASEGSAFEVEDLDQLAMDSASDWTESELTEVSTSETVTEPVFDSEELAEEEVAEEEVAEETEPELVVTIPEPVATQIHVTINGQSHVLSGKDNYMFIDIFNVIDFDTTQSHGRSVYTKVNGQIAGYMDPLHEGDTVEIGWEEN